MHVVFDGSGSFNEVGKKFMLNYLGNTVENLKLAFEDKVEFVFYTWSNELREVESVEKIPARGVTDVEVLRKFLLGLGAGDAVILITDGDFDGVKKSSFRSAVNSLGKRFAVIAAGYDAATVQLQKLSPNFFMAEDMMTAFNFFLSGSEAV